MLLLEYGSSNQSTGVSLTSSGADQRLAQRIKLRRDAPIGCVSLYLKKTGSPTGYLYVEIQTDSSSDPSGNTISNGTSEAVPMSDVGSSYSYIDFDFDDSLRPLASKNTSIHIVLKASGYTYSSGTTEVVWGADQSAPHYINGEGETYDSSWSDLSPDTDFCFKAYSKERAVYSYLSQVESLVRGLTENGMFTHDSNVTAASAMDFEEMVADEIDSWLSGAGFSTPIADEAVLGLLRSYAAAGVALYCQMTQRTSGFRGERGADTRTGAFKALYHGLRNDLREGGELVDALITLGLGRSGTGSLGAGLTAGGIDYDEHEDWEDDVDDEELVSPSFARGMWDNE